MSGTLTDDYHVSANSVPARVQQCVCVCVYDLPLVIVSHTVYCFRVTSHATPPPPPHTHTHTPTPPGLYTDTPSPHPSPKPLSENRFIFICIQSILHPLTCGFCCIAPPPPHPPSTAASPFHLTLLTDWPATTDTPSPSIIVPRHFVHLSSTLCSLLKPPPPPPPPHTHIFPPHCPHHHPLPSKYRRLGPTSSISAYSVFASSMQAASNAIHNRKNLVTRMVLQLKVYILGFRRLIRICSGIIYR